MRGRKKKKGEKKREKKRKKKKEEGRRKDGRKEGRKEERRKKERRKNWNFQETEFSGHNQTIVPCVMASFVNQRTKLRS